jgi:hypothetical protein
MNERIKELALLSGFDIDTNVSFAEKTRLHCFAELLIKECADYVQFYYKDHMCEVIAHDMKTHFGVEA